LTTSIHSEDHIELASLDELKQTVEGRQGVLTTKLRVIRDAYGAKKTGKHVLRNITDSLKDLGLGHFPLALPKDQHETIRVYKLDSPIAEVIGAVLTPSPANDEVLRDAAGGEAAEILARVRELVSK
jgi:hypothetical protein